MNALITPKHIGRRTLAALAVEAAVLASVPLYIGSGSTDPFLSSAVYATLMLLPGSILYLIVSARARTVEFFLYTLLAGPLLLAVLSSVAMALRLPAGYIPLLFVPILFFASLLLALAGRFRLEGSGMDRRSALALLFVTAVFVLLTAYEPLSSQWWRMRSDAWFHAAVVRQIEYGGIPPEDPYFAGMPLQYMWFYHVMVLVVSEASRIDPFTVMALINVQFLAGFIVATFLFSSSMSPERRFAPALASVLAALLTLNGLFWLFLPVKALRALVGEIRGLDELSRTFSLSPLDLRTVRSFLRIHYNQVFFLDKFMVATAFTLALSYMAALWYGVTEYLRSGRCAFLVLVAGLGLWSFHPAPGLIMYAGFGGGLFALHMRRKRIEDYDGRRVAKAALLLALAPMLLAPYVYSIVHAKQGPPPIGFSLDRTIGYFISVSLALFLAAFRLRSIDRSRSAFARFYLMATAVIALFCLLLELPGANAFNKPPFFIFYPLAVVGGWTIYGWYRALVESGRRISALAVAALILLPVNIVAFAGYYNTPGEQIVSAGEKKAARWVSANTTRDAVFIDDWRKPFLLVEGPRRYYFGSRSYAKQWGYDPAEMARRKAAVEDLYSPDSISCETFRSLAGTESEIYIMARTEPAGISGRLEGYGDVLQRVYSADGIVVFRLDRTGVERRCGGARGAGKGKQHALFR